MKGKAVPILIALNLMVCGCGKGDDAQQSNPATPSEADMRSDQESRPKPESRRPSNSELPSYLVIKPDKRNPLIGMEYLSARKRILRREWIRFKGQG